jgi:hypothetical protein
MLTIDSIRPLVADHTQTARTVQVRFCCPRSGREVEGEAPLRKQDGMQADAARVLRKELFRSAKRSLMGAVKGALGGSSIAGKVAGTAIRSGTRDAEAKAKFSSAEVDAAIVAAFGTVQGEFRWDEAEAAWVAVAQ